MRLIISKKADKQLSKLNPFIRKKLLKNLRNFTKGERVDIKKMKGKDDEYRIRVGEYRILTKKFQNNDCLVTELGKREYLLFSFVEYKDLYTIASYNTL